MNVGLDSQEDSFRCQGHLELGSSPSVDSNLYLTHETSRRTFGVTLAIESACQPLSAHAINKSRSVDGVLFSTINVGF